MDLRETVLEPAALGTCTSGDCGTGAGTRGSRLRSRRAGSAAATATALAASAQGTPNARSTPVTWSTDREPGPVTATKEAKAPYTNGTSYPPRCGLGRQVANPAGIDPADGTFYNVGLDDNGWVTVTRLWTDGGDTTSFPTWGTDVSVRQQATTTSTRVTGLPGPTTVRVRCQVHGQLVTYDGCSNDAWSYLSDYGGYVSNIFNDVADPWLPDVPTC